MDRSQEIEPEDIDIEQIMQEIRQQILLKAAALDARGRPLVPVSGERFSAEFYEQLYLAGISYNQLVVEMNVTRVSIPLIGPLIQGLRRKLHELVLFYVNQVAVRQIETNSHLLQALSILSQELEESGQP